MASVTVDQIVLDFAKEKYFEWLENTLDDPSYILQDEDETPTAYIEQRRILGQKMGLDLDFLVKNWSNDFESIRLLHIMKQTDWVWDRWKWI